MLIGKSRSWGFSGSIQLGVKNAFPAACQGTVPCACNKVPAGMLLCVDIDSDDLQLILVTAAEYDKISALAEQAGHRIAPAETL
ncbi:MAG: hypothetical protein ACLUOF_06310 [Ruminococcus sp.]